MAIRATPRTRPASPARRKVRNWSRARRIASRGSPWRLRRRASSPRQTAAVQRESMVSARLAACWSQVIASRGEWFSVGEACGQFGHGDGRGVVNAAGQVECFVGPGHRGFVLVEERSVGAAVSEDVAEPVGIRSGAGATDLGVAVSQAGLVVALKVGTVGQDVVEPTALPVDERLQFEPGLGEPDGALVVAGYAASPPRGCQQHRVHEVSGRHRVRAWPRPTSRARRNCRHIA